MGCALFFRARRFAQGVTHAGTTTSGKLDPAASVRSKAKVAQFLD
ncbi:MAG: hypothetical protein ACRC4V_20300 [Aeromonas veronii]